MASVVLKFAPLKQLLLFTKMIYYHSKFMHDYCMLNGIIYQYQLFKPLFALICHRELHKYLHLLVITFYYIGKIHGNEAYDNISNYSVVHPS